MSRDLSHIQGIIWDLDGTLYRYDSLFLQACNHAAAKTAIALGLDMNFDDALALAEQSYILHGSSFKLFAAHGLEYKDFHHPYHESVDATILQKNQEMKDELKALGMPMVILTNASRPWALRTIEHLEYGDIFGDGYILSLEDVDHQSKGHSAHGILKAASILNLSPENILMVEDLPANLVHAKTQSMTTALVHHGQLPAKGLDHIDLFYQDTLELVKELNAR